MSRATKGVTGTNVGAGVGVARGVEVGGMTVGRGVGVAVGSSTAEVALGAAVGAAVGAGAVDARGTVVASATGVGAAVVVAGANVGKGVAVAAAVDRNVVGAGVPTTPTVVGAGDAAGDVATVDIAAGLSISVSPPLHATSNDAMSNTSATIGTRIHPLPKPNLFLKCTTAFSPRG